MDTLLKKADLRALMRHRLSQMTVNERAVASAAIVRRIRSLKLWSEASTVLAFIPLRTEADILPLLDTAMDEGKTVAIPRCEFGATLSFHQVAQEYREHLVKGPFSLQEPPATWPLIDMATVREPMMVLVPALAFTLDGMRLGRGKGYYDRLLTELSGRGTTLGICFDIQVVGFLETEEHDRAVDVIVTEKKTYM